MFKSGESVSASDLMDLVRKLNSAHTHTTQDTYQGIGWENSPLYTDIVTTSATQIGCGVNVQAGTPLSVGQARMLADALQYLLVHKHTHTDKRATACNCNCNCNCTRGSF